MSDNRAQDQALLEKLLRMHLHTTTTALLHGIAEDAKPSAAGAGAETGAYQVVRVPGGWLYVNVFSNRETFVPFPVTQRGLDDV